MSISRIVRLVGLIALAFIIASCGSSSKTTEEQAATQTTAAPSDPLPSWNDGPTKTAIVDFVRHTSSPGDPEFVAVAERIAVFDNDGTLWVEQPMYVQLAFAIDRVKALAPDHPEWRYKEPFKSILAGDVRGAMAGGHKAIEEIVMATHSGMTSAQFEEVVKDWIAIASHPTLNRAYTQCAYQPMLELLTYLRQSGYKTYIVSGGGVEFMRPWTERVYGIPPEQVIGSQIEVKFEIDKNGQPVLRHLPQIFFIDDGPGKPIAINRVIGRRPRLAFGNSDGDQQMLEWTAVGDGPRLAALLHHTDEGREWKYDRESAVGKLDKALDEAKEKHWVVVDMKEDWNAIFPKPR